jgi:hypothetical protein
MHSLPVACWRTVVSACTLHGLHTVSCRITQQCTRLFGVLQSLSCYDTTSIIYDDRSPAAGVASADVVRDIGFWVCKRSGPARLGFVQHGRRLLCESSRAAALDVKKLAESKVLQHAVRATSVGMEAALLGSTMQELSWAVMHVVLLQLTLPHLPCLPGIRYLWIWLLQYNITIQARCHVSCACCAFCICRVFCSIKATVCDGPDATHTCVAIVLCVDLQSAMV